MGASERKNRDRAMAAYPIAIGLPHGKRSSKGLSNIPNLGEVGSAAYRRLTDQTKKS